MKKFLILLFLLMSNVFALDPLYTYDSWNVYQSVVDNKDICYIMALPIEKRGNYKKRGEPYIIVSRVKGSNFMEVVVSGSFLNDEKKPGDVMILKRKFPLYVRNEKAFTVDRNDDVEIIRLMNLREAKRVYVRNFFNNGSFAVDVYSTNGFVLAYQKLLEICI
ncbi:MAG: hypothetical protein Ta2D_10100 [Rickettsiales bacterium]|nr:MAG: hypothetical protein Ta2D_10100 [Rickettsiales bacterium]